MLKRLNYVFLFLILLGGFIVRLYKINRPLADWHSWRQVDTASVTRIYIEEGIDILHPRFYDVSTSQSGHPNPNGYRFVEFPIYNLIHVFVFKMYPQISLEVWGRFISIFFSLVSTVLLYLIGKKFLGEVGGLIAAFFFVFLPYNVFFSTVVLPEPLMVAFALLSIWAFILFTEKGRYLYLFISAASFSLAILIKPYIVFFDLPILYLAYEKWGKEIFRKVGLYIATIVAVSPFLIWRMWSLNFPEGIPHYIWAFNGDGIRFRPAFWRWIFGERLARLILGFWGLIPFSFGILRKKSGFILSFLLGMFLYVSVVASANVRHDYYQIVAIPSISLALASGVLWMWNGKDLNRLFSRILVLFSVAMMLGMGAYQIKEDYKIDHPEIIEAGEAVDKLVPKNAKVIASYNEDTAFLYQTKRYGWPLVDDRIENLIRKGASYFVSVNLSGPDTTTLLKNYQVVKKTDSYVIIDLTKPLGRKI